VRLAHAKMGFLMTELMQFALSVILQNVLNVQVLLIIVQNVFQEQVEVAFQVVHVMQAIMI